MSEVRISIGNLAPLVVIKETGHQTFYGIYNSGAWKKGNKLLQPLGGAAHLTDKGRERLEKDFGAHDFHKSDARFVIPEEHLEAVLQLFENRDPEIFEIDPTREVVEELTREELPPLPPVLTPEEAALIQVVYVCTARQPFKDEAGTSPLEREGIPSRRLFHFSMLIVPEQVWLKINRSEALVCLLESEIASTDGGLHKGVAEDYDLNTVTLADNFFWPPSQEQ